MADKVKLYLVRHGQAAGGWDEHLDPGLDETGREQAQMTAAALAGLGPLPIIVSPMRRARETAAPLETIWSIEAGVEPAVSEIPTPADDLAGRTAWLERAMLGPWSDLAPELIVWRDRLLLTLSSIKEDTVVVTHFIAINAAVGAANGDDRLVCFQPDNCSVTLIQVVEGRFEVVRLGREKETIVR